MQVKQKNSFDKYKFAFLIFAFIFAYNFFIVNRFELCRIDNVTYTYHIVDFSLGFCTKLLPGAVYNAIFSSTDSAMVNAYFSVLYFVFMAAVSLFLGRYISEAKPENKLAALVAVMFFVSGPATFSLHAKEFGMLDTYWLFFSLAVMAFLQSKYLKWIVPLFFALALLIHISAIVSFVPFMALLVLLEASREKENKKSFCAIFGFSAALSLLLFAYFAVAENGNLVYDIKEFGEFIHKRNLSEWPDYTVYYDYALYKKPYLQYSTDKITGEILIEGTGFLAKIVNAAWSQIAITFTTYSTLSDGYYLELLNMVFFTLPVTAVLYRYVFVSFKKSKGNPLRRFVWFCSLFLFPLAFFAGSLGSPDITRWYGHAFMLVFSLVIYEMSRTQEVVSVSKNKNKQSVYFIVTAVYYLLYAVCTVEPYCY